MAEKKKATMRPIRIKGRPNKDGGHYWPQIGIGWVDENKVTLDFYADTIVGPGTHIIVSLKDREQDGS